MTLQCEAPCPNAERIALLAANDKEQSSRIDKILQILTDSTLDGGSVVDRLRKNAAEIVELKAQIAEMRSSLATKSTLKDRAINKVVETLVQGIIGGLFLLLTRGVIAEIFSRAPHP